MNSFNLPGYLLNECLHQGVDTVIYRARKESDLSTVIVKTIKAEYPTLEEITHLRHEYKILQHLAGTKGIIKVYDFIHYESSFAILLEDCWGVSFQELIHAQRLPILSFLSLAIQTAEILHEVHQKNIIHKDINPQNILLEPDFLTVKLIDFSIASRLSRETPSASNPDLLAGTLAYISPEATGRMNRVVDYRADFYSLGVTFYEMLVGQLPFMSEDSLELVHCHIAKNPIPPHQVNSQIPQAISEIVMKLMAKNAEDRYQSALGLKADLETCFNQLRSGGQLIHLTPGQLDKSGQFLIPQKLYGRISEVRALLMAFYRISAGAAEMFLVSGYSGIGKTSVVHEVHKPIVAARGYFIAGKFDQFKRNIPYAALIQAFQGLIRQLLTESAAKLAQWQEIFLEALGQNGQVMIDVIPEVEYLIGKQPSVPQLGVAESQTRLHRVFQQFIGAVAKREHPLVLFLDDLQWADSASLKLMESAICDLDSQYLLLIGAYRDREVSPTHPTAIALEKIQSSGAIVNQIVLQALNFSDVTELICDALGETFNAQLASPAPPPSQCGGRVQPLAELIYSKTQGNPFFLTQLLQTLYTEKLLYFDFEQSRWQWGLDQIHALSISDDNVVDLVAKNIQKLADSTQQLLKLAACIGHQFNLNTLAVVNETSLLNTANELWEALQSSLILPLSQAYKIPLFMSQDEQKYLVAEDLKVSYKFLHDRVQQAAYSLIPESQKKKIHLKIGKLLLQKTAQGSLEENIFDIVNQLNLGVELITTEVEREELAALNLIAGKKAKATAAMETAVKYLNLGLELLSESSWIHSYELALNLHIEAVEAEYRNTHYDRAQQLSNLVLSKAKEPLQKIQVYETKIQFHIAKNQMLEAIDTAVEVLEMLGVSLSKQPNQLNLFTNQFFTKLTINAKRIKELANLPEMTDPDKIAAMRILLTALVPAFLTTPHLFPAITFKMVNLSVRYGNSPQAAYGYALYGWLLCGALGEIEDGYQFGQLAMQLFEQFEAKELKCKGVNVFNAFIRHWQEPARKTIPAFVESLQMSLETGNIEYAGYSSINYCHYTFLIGEELEHLKTAHQPYIDLMRKLKQEYALHSVSTVRQTILNLLGESENPCYLLGENFNEQEMIGVFQQANVLTSLFMVYCYKAMLFFLFKHPGRAVESAELAENYLASVQGFMTITVHKFYYSLALLAQVSKGKVAALKTVLKKVETNQKQMQIWAKNAPENYRHKYELVEAEKARVLGREAKAVEFYQRAIQGASNSGYIQEEALAQELTAEFYFSCGKETLGEVYLLQSYYSYIRWGAKAKVRDLELRYPELFSRVLQREAVDITALSTATTSKTTINSASLDLAAVTKAVAVISSEKVLDRLLLRLMQITMENVGASKGFLFLSKAHQLWLVVQGNIDQVWLLSGVSLATVSDLPLSLINYVERTKETVVLNNPISEELLAKDPYIQRVEPKSIFCWPLLHETQLVGILYLENHLSVGAFTPGRLEVLQLLANQASIYLNQLGKLKL
ncbi:MAG: AAA family ATPase [Actinomycetota bacterium]